MQGNTSRPRRISELLVLPRQPEGIRKAWSQPRRVHRVEGDVDDELHLESYDSPLLSRPMEPLKHRIYNSVQRVRESSKGRMLLRVSRGILLRLRRL